jgi:NhaP-type Na+/H+ or K+/H+ antiporter
LTAEGSGGFNLFAVSGQFVWVVALGLAIGLILGGLALFWIGRVFNDPMIEISLSIALAYLAFMVAEHAFHVSGVVAIVAAALLFAGIGRTRISPEVAGFLHHFWEMMAHIANTLIFLLVGILVAARVPLNSPQLWLALGILYIGVLIIRGGCIGLFTPLLKRISIGFNRDKALVLWWGGLRGAVSLSLALVLAQGGYLPEELGSQVLFLCAGVVVLTILINGSTMEWLLAKLNLNALPPAKQATVDKARGVIQGELKEFLPQLTSDEFLQQANWENVRERLNLNEEAVEQPKEAKADASKEDLAIAFRRRILETERKHYWWQFNRGTLRRRSTQKLVEAVEHALDGDPEINPRKELFDLLQMPPIVRLLANSPRFNQLLLRMTFTRLALGYDVVRGFMLAQEEIAKHVDALAPSPEEAQFVADQILQNKRDTYEQLTQFQESFPELIQILESFSATRLLLNRQRMVIQRLLSEAVLDAPEGERLIQEVDHHMAQLETLPAEVPAADPSNLIRQSSWVQGINPTTLEKLMNAINQRIYSAGDTIMKQGSSGGSLGILLRGTTEVVEIEGDQEKVTEILGPGSLVGLMSLITGINPHTVKAAAFVDILWLDATDLKPLMSSDATLASNLTQLMTKGTEH